LAQQATLSHGLVAVISVGLSGLGALALDCELQRLLSCGGCCIAAAASMLNVIGTVKVQACLVAERHAAYKHYLVAGKGGLVCGIHSVPHASTICFTSSADASIRWSDHQSIEKPGGQVHQAHVSFAQSILAPCQHAMRKAGTMPAW
jgi:hypothetical protein